MERVRIIFLWMVVVLVPSQNTYSNQRGVETLTRSNNFTRFEENGKVGLKDESGQVLIPAAYDAIGWSNGTLSIIDRVVGYKLNGLWGLIHTSNRIVTPAEFITLTPGEGSHLVGQKRSALSQRSSFGVLNTTGKTVIPFTYDGLKLAHMRAIVMSRSGTKFRFGLTNLDHKILIPVEYQQIYSLGSLRFAVQNFDDKIAIFSDEGHPVTPFTIDSISVFKNDYAIVFQNQQQGLIDRNGEFILKPVYGEVRLNEDGTIQMRETDSWFLLNGRNELLREYQADLLKPLSPDHYAVMRGGKLQLTDNTFQPVHSGFFSSVTKFHDDVALFRYRGKTGAITRDAKILIPAEYQELIVDGNVFLACLDTGYKNRWAILDRQGNEVTAKHYESIAPSNGKFFPVQNRGYWGAVDLEGKEIITCVHDSIVQQKANYLVVTFKGGYGIVNLQQYWIVTPQPNPLTLLNNELYFEYGGETTFLKSLKGDIIYFSDNALEFHGAYMRETLPSGASRIIDLSGVIVSRSNEPEEVEAVFPEREGFRAIRKDGKFGFIDNAGRLRIANRYERVQSFSGGRAAIRIRNKWGFIDTDETLVVQPIYDRVEDFKNGLAIVTRDNLSGLLDDKGDIVLPVRYDEITLNDHSRFILRQGASYGLADDSGTVVIRPKYDELIDTGNGYVVVQRGGKFGVLTLGGVSTIPMIYDGLTYDPYHNQYMAVKKSPWQRFESPRSTVDGPQ